MNDFNKNTQEIASKNSSRFTQENVHNIPFDDFYLFLVENQAYTMTGEKGEKAREEVRVVGRVLLEKFKTAFQDEEVALLPVGNNHSMATLTNRQNAKDVFATHHGNQKNQFNRFKTENDLMQNVYKYRNATLQHQEVDRQKSLEAINEVLTPFYTALLKVEEKPKKKKFFGLF